MGLGDALPLTSGLQGPALHGCGGPVLLPRGPEHVRGSATRGPAQSAQAKEIKDDDPQASESGVVGPRVAGLLTSVRCAPCSALPPGTWAAVLLETLSCAGLSFCLWIVGSVGQGSFLRERGSAERGAHPRCSHIPWGLRDARARRFPDSLFIGEFQPDAWE